MINLKKQMAVNSLDDLLFAMQSSYFSILAKYLSYISNTFNKVEKLPVLLTSLPAMIEILAFP